MRSLKRHLPLVSLAVLPMVSRPLQVVVVALVTLALLTHMRHEERLERSVERARRRARAVFDSSCQLVGLIDAKGLLVDANRAALDLVGAEAADVLGRPLVEGPWWDHSEELREAMRHSLARAGLHDTLRMRTTHAARDGSVRQIDLSIRPIVEPDGSVRYRVVEGRDITDIVQAEASLQRLERELSQAKRLEALRTLASGIAHDFNDLLAAVLGNLELARTESVPALRSEQLSDAHAAAVRARGMVRRILSLGDREALQPTSVEPIVRDAARVVRAATNTSLDLEIAIERELPCAAADPDQLHQVVANLLTNAVHAMEAHGGTLRVTAARAEGPRGAQGVLLSVVDQGLGIPDSLRERIFEPFFTTKPLGKGTGLGLAVVRGIVERHQGRLTLESSVGLGTAVRIWLPAIDGEEQPPSSRRRLCAVGEEASVPMITLRALATA